MAILTATNPTLADWVKYFDPDGKVAIVGELLAQTNEVLQDQVHIEANGITGHQTTVRTGLPDTYLRAINKGIAHSKSETAQVVFPCSLVEARSEIDKKLIELNGNGAQVRMQEDRAFIEAMNQRMVSMLFYGNPATDPLEFTGFANHYNTLLTTSSPNAANVLDAKGTPDAPTTNLTSVWLVGWGDQTVFSPFPKGTKAGLVHEDLGEQTVYTEGSTAGSASSTLRMQAMVSRFEWNSGLAIKDWAYVVRICNIDTVDLLAQATSQAPTAGTALIKLMARAMNHIPNLRMCRPAFYMNRTCFAGLQLAALDKSQSAVAIQTGLSQFGTPMSWLSFLGVPIRQVDALTNSETQVV